MYFFSSSVLLKGYEALEDKQLNQNTIRLQEIVANEHETLRLTVNAWSVWDESYRFVQDRNKEFYPKNFLIDSIFDVRFSEVIYFDLKGNILVAQDYDFHHRKYLPANKERLADVKQVFWNDKTRSIAIKPGSGLYSFKDKFSLYTLNPVLPGSGQGKPKGYILVFRNFDEDMLKRFEKIIKFKLEMKTLTNASLTETQVSYEKQHSFVQGYIALPGLKHQNALQIKMTMPRSIYLFGEEKIGKYLGAISLSAYAFVFVLFAIFDRAIIKRIALLKKDLNEISKENSQIARVSVKGHDEISDLAQNINSTLQALDQKQMIINRTSKLTALGEMAASVAHEINSPLSVIDGFAKRITRLISQHQYDEQQLVNAAQKINSNVSRIDKIVKSLRVISRDSEQEEKAPTTLGSLLDDVLSLCQVKLNVNNIKLDLSEIDPLLELNVRSIQLSQVLINLINNAVDAIEGQEEPWIKIKSEKTNHEIIITVTDSGPIISDQIADKIMTPFFTTKDPGKGTGLGLSISKGIIEGHGGKFLLETTPHTSFKIILPMK